MPAFENLRIHMVHGDSSKTAAFVSCKILTEAGALFLNSMALVRGANGLYLSFPSRKRDGQPVKGFEDYYYMERGLKELVQATAIEEFKKRCEEMGLDAEKASAPLPPGSHGEDEDRDYAPREYREPQPRQPFRNESRPINGGYGNGGGNRGGYGGGGYGGNGGYSNGGGGAYGNGGGYGNGGAYGDRGANRGGGYGDRNPGRSTGGGGGYGDRGPSRGNGGGGYGDRGPSRGNGGGYGDRSPNRGGGGYRGDDFGNRAGGYRGGPNDDRNNHGFPTGPNLANRPLSNRFNPYTGNDELQADKPGPGNEAPKQREKQNDEGVE